MDHVDVQVSDSFAMDRLPELMALFVGQWWTQDRQVDDVATMLDNSDLIATASDANTGELLGFGRVLSDFTYLACVMDVIVAEQSRGKGVGAALMDALVTDPRLAQVQSLELTCQEDLEGFYARWGFTSRVGGSRLMRRTDSPFFLSD
jgi:predicted GNAT family N-acyltransferase